MSHTSYQEWKEWVRKNQSLMQHPANFEARFVLEVLSSVSEITPSILYPQYEFIDRQNKTRRIDFVVLDESRGLGLAIELDGLSKLEEKDTHSTNYAKFDDLLARQNDLLSSTKGKIFMLFRFSNKRWLSMPQEVAKQISEELCQELKAYQEMLKHNRFADEVARSLAETQAERGSLLKRLKELEQKLAQETKNPSSSSDSSQGEKRRLLQELAQKEKALTRALALQEQAKAELDETRKKLEQERRSRMIEQQQRAEADALRDKDIADLKKRMDEVQSAQKVQRNSTSSSSSNSHKSGFTKLICVSLVFAIIGGVYVWRLGHQEKSSPTVVEKEISTIAPQVDRLVLSPENASDHIGERATVCGTLVEINPLGDMNFLNFDRPFPNNIFTCGIDDTDASQFMGINKLIGKKICVTGVLRKYGSKTGMKLSKRTQLED